MAGNLAEAGQGDRALAVARGIEDAFWRVMALGEVAVQLAGAGQHDRALAVARG